MKRCMVVDLVCDIVIQSCVCWWCQSVPFHKRLLESERLKAMLKKLHSCQVPDAVPGCEDADLSFLGPLVSDEVARAIAAGAHAVCVFLFTGCTCHLQNPSYDHTVRTCAKWHGQMGFCDVQ